jgi:hypothetical protein
MSQHIERGADDVRARARVRPGQRVVFVRDADAH